MARHYHVRCDYTPSEGDSLHAGWAREGLLQSAESLYEDSTIWDTPIVLPAPVTLSGSGMQLALGPHPVPIRYDRDGLLRRLYAEPLCDRGSTAQLAWYMFATDSYREPDTSGLDDPYATWVVTSAAPAWQTASYIDFPREWTCATPYAWSDGTDIIRVRMAWITLYVSGPGAYAPTVCGLHLYDHVDTA